MSFGVEPMSRENFDAMKAEEARVKADRLAKEAELLPKPIEVKEKIKRPSTNKKYIVKKEVPEPRPSYLVTTKKPCIRNKYNSAEYQRELYARKKAKGVGRQYSEKELEARRERGLKYYHENKERIKQRRKEYYAKLEGEKLEALKLSNKKACTKRRESMTEEEKEARRQQEREKRHNMTPEEKIAYKAKLKQKREEKDASMTEEQRKERSRLHLEYKKNMEAILTPKQKEEKLEYARHRRTLRKRGVSVDNIRPLWSWESKDKQFPLGSVIWSKDD